MYGSDDVAMRWSTGFSSESLADLADAFERLPRRRLVLLGAEGAGKTAVSVALAHELLSRRGSSQPGTTQPNRPIPVLFPLGASDPGDLLTYRPPSSRRRVPQPGPFDQWLARQLVSRYGWAFGGPRRRALRHALTLVRDGRVLPILDEFDAWAGSSARAVTMIGDSPHPIIVNCRSDEYTSAVNGVDEHWYRVPLDGAAVLELQPVPPEQATAYLRQVTPDHHQAKWDEVFARLDRSPDGPLAEAMATPFMLWLAGIGYGARDAGPGGLLDASRFPDRTSVQSRLIDTFIDAGDPDRRDPDWARRHWAPLAFLAARLRRSGTSELAWWRLPAELPPHLTGAVLGGLGGVCTVLTVIAGAALGRWTDVVTTLGPDMAGRVGLWAAMDVVPVGIAFAVVVALLTGIAGWQAARRSPAPVTFTWRLGSRPRILIEESTRGAAFGAAGATLFVAILMVLFGRDPAWHMAPAGYLIAVPAGAVMLLMQGQVMTDTTQGDRPSGVLRNDRRAALVSMAFSAIVTGVLAGLVLKLVVRPADNPPVLATAFTFGVGAAIVRGARAAWLHFTIARIWLAARSPLPWQLIRFLDQAYESRHKGLRRVGGVYEFRHRLLRERLAHRWENQHPEPVRRDGRRRWWVAMTAGCALVVTAGAVGATGGPSRTTPTVACDAVAAHRPVEAPVPVVLHRTGCVLRATTDVFTNYRDKIDADTGEPGRGSTERLVGPVRDGGLADLIVEYHRIRSASDTPSFALVRAGRPGGYQTCRTFQQRPGRLVATIRHSEIRRGDQLCVLTDERRTALVQVVEPPTPPRPRMVVDVTVWADR
ncbi:MULTISPECIES: hypothetical protein [unclassified Micromonospora]|uniref:hypothetical protein n=2 Tax=Micromonospora TaxID=1873 RepID=UPI003A8B0C78